MVGSISTAVRDDHLAIAWFATVGDETGVFVSRSLDGGSSFSAPLRVSPPGEPLFREAHAAPRVDLILDPDGFEQPVLAWRRIAANATIDVWSYTVDGTAYSRPDRIPESGGVSVRQLQSITRDPADRMVATWSRLSTTHDAVRDVETADGRRFTAWVDSARAPPVVRMRRLDGQRSPPSISLGAGEEPRFTTPSSGPVLIWISRRGTGREINLIRPQEPPARSR